MRTMTAKSGKICFSILQFPGFQTDSKKIFIDKSGYNFISKFLVYFADQIKFDETMSKM